MSEIEIGELEDIQALFVQSAQSSVRREQRHAVGLSQTTLYFSDRLQREVGHLRRITSSSSGPRVRTTSSTIHRTVLSFLESRTAAPEDAVVVIRGTMLDGDALRYSIDLLDARSRVRRPVLALHRSARSPLSQASLAASARERRRMRR